MLKFELGACLNRQMLHHCTISHPLGQNCYNYISIMAFMILTHMNIDTKHQENLKLNNPNLFSLKKDKDSSNCRELKKKKTKL